MNALLKRLIKLGYSKHKANHVYALHFSCGTIDLLECYVLKPEQEVINHG